MAMPPPLGTVSGARVKSDASNPAPRRQHTSRSPMHPFASPPKTHNSLNLGLSLIAARLPTAPLTQSSQPLDPGPLPPA
eukprot:3172307-Pleurochrysis_carterae.AAC.1